MKKKSSLKKKLKPAKAKPGAEIARLRAELEEARETLRAIQSGEVDALVIGGTKGEQVFTLKSAEQPYRILVETMNEGAATLDANGVVYYCNQCFAQLVRQPLEKVISSPLERFVHEEDVALFKGALKEGTTRAFKCTLRLRAGKDSLCWVQLSMNPVEIDTSPGLCIVATDLTEQKKLEAAHADVVRLNLERDTRERFVSTLTHDLRNPLGAAVVSAQLISRFPDQRDKHPELLNRIIDSIGRADKMILDLLDANQIRAGEKLHLQIGKCDLVETARMTLEELRLTHGDRFVLESEPQIQGYWSCTQLRRVIENLATNAVKYGAKGAPVRVQLGDVRDRVTLSVHNEGEGLSEAEKAELFKPFSRSHSAKLSGQSGWGLGLTLVRGVVDAHGGQIHVQSEPNQGTTFRVILPKDARPFQNSRSHLSEESRT